MEKFKGIYCPLITPYKDDYSVDKVALKELIDYQIKNEVDGLYLLGSTGEGLILSIDKRMEIAELAKEFLGNRGRIIVHVGAVDTETSIKLSQHAKSIGVDAISAVPPFYYKPDLKSILKHYKAIAVAGDLPLLVYNIPACVGYSLTASDLREIIKIDNVIGLKFSSADMYEFSKVRQLDNELVVFFGTDEMLLSGLVTGADGGIGSFCNIMPEAFVGLYKSIKDKNLIKARTLQFKINKCIQICSKYPYGSWKVILKHMGFPISKKMMLPLREMTDDEEQALIEELNYENFFNFKS